MIKSNDTHKLFVNNKTSAYFKDLDQSLWSIGVVLAFIVISGYTLGWVSLQKLKASSEIGAFTMTMELQSFTKYIIFFMVIWLVYLFNCFH